MNYKTSKIFAAPRLCVEKNKKVNKPQYALSLGRAGRVAVNVIVYEKIYPSGICRTMFADSESCTEHKS